MHHYHDTLAPFPDLLPPGAPPAAKREKIAVVCLECGKRFRTTRDIPECPKCGGSDVDVREPESGK